MTDLISKSELYEKVCTWEAQALHMCEVTMNDEDNTDWRRWSAILKERSAFKFDVADAPTIDAVPVVRCKDCIALQHCRFTQGLGLDGFCSQGERREEDGKSND